MTFWVAGSVVASSLIGANASSKAASTQANAANRAAELQNEQFQQTRQDQMPWLEAGRNALAKLGTGFTGQVDLTQDPGYAFRLSEGQKALDRAAAARGGLISGGALKAAQRYGQDYGSQEYQNAYNRALTQYNTTAGLAGIGQTTAQNLGAAGAANANAIGNYLTGGAAAQAAGTVGGANALTSGLGTYLNYSQGNNLLAALQNRGGGYGTVNYGSMLNPNGAGGAATATGAENYFAPY